MNFRPRVRLRGLEAAIPEEKLMSFAVAGVTQHLQLRRFILPGRDGPVCKMMNVEDSAGLVSKAALPVGRIQRLQPPALPARIPKLFAVSHARVPRTEAGIPR